MNFKHIIVLTNPASTSAPRALKRINELQTLFPKTTVDILYTSPEGRDATQELIATEAQRLGPDTLLCIAGGDGTVGIAVEALMTHPHLSEDARQTTILPLWGGNANDLANMLNGGPTTSLRDVFAHARRMPVHPLQLTLTDKNGYKKVRIAICYAGFGASALATKKISEPAHRNHPMRKFILSRLLLESITTITAFLRASRFKIEEEGQEKRIYERTVSNGPRIAKMERLPLKLDDEAFCIYTIENAAPLKTILSLATGSTRKQTSSDMHRQYAAFTLKDPTYSHFDGESQDIPADTTVTVELSKRPLHVLTTRLNS